MNEKQYEWLFSDIDEVIDMAGELKEPKENVWNRRTNNATD